MGLRPLLAQMPDGRMIRVDMADVAAAIVEWPANHPDWDAAVDEWVERRNPGWLIALHRAFWQ